MPFPSGGGQRLIEQLTCEVWEAFSTILCSVQNAQYTIFAQHIHLQEVSIRTLLRAANYGKYSLCFGSAQFVQKNLGFSVDFGYYDNAVCSQL